MHIGKKILFVVFAVLIGFGIAHAGPKTILQLTEETAPTSDDLVHVWEVTGGNARKSTLSNVTKGLRDGSTTVKGVVQLDADNFDVSSGVVTLDTQTKGIIINAATAADDFLIWRTEKAITITDIYGVLQSGTNVVGGLDECDANGANPVAVDADITFDGGLDQDDGALTNGGIDAGDWIKWRTTSVNAPGYLTVTINYTID